MKQNNYTKTVQEFCVTNLSLVEIKRCFAFQFKSENNEILIYEVCKATGTKLPLFFLHEINYFLETGIEYE